MAEANPQTHEGATAASDPLPNGDATVEWIRLEPEGAQRYTRRFTKTILIIEDDPATREVVRLACVGQNLNLAEADSAEVGLDQLEEIDPDLIILDLNLSGASGIDFCRRLRMEGFQYLVIMLTARSETIDIIVGLEVGADDYLTKPFEVRELLARVWAHLRRNEQGVARLPKRRLEFPGLRLDLDSRQVWRDGAEVVLTLTEFNLLSELASHPGKVISRGELLHNVWGYEVEIETRTVDAHVYRLRKKIDAGVENPQFIQSVPGIGYRFIGA
jgi:two-component system, OmpR family, response regulator MtrA